MNGSRHSTIILDTWQDVEIYTDSTRLRFPVSYLNLVNSKQFPHDAFTLGQLSSKAWLLEELFNITLKRDPSTAVLLGSWVGTLVLPFLERADTSWRIAQMERVYGIDSDPEAVDLSEQFNHRLVESNWRYKGVVADVDMLNCSDMEFETGGELITLRPDIVFNTSCEHMSSDWFHTCHPDQLVVMQTNDSPDYDGHINTCASMDEVREKYPMRDCLYSGELVTPAYTRYMQIGYL
jgi:hypothetical protein